MQAIRKWPTYLYIDAIVFLSHLCFNKWSLTKIMAKLLGAYIFWRDYLKSWMVSTLDVVVWWKRYEDAGETRDSSLYIQHVQFCDCFKHLNHQIPFLPNQIKISSLLQYWTKNKTKLIFKIQKVNTLNMCFSWFFKSQKKTTKQRNVTTCTNSTHQPAPMTRPDRPTSSVPRYCQGGDNKMHRNKLPKEGQHPLGKSAMPQPCHENMSRFLMVENHVFFLNNCDVLLMLCFFCVLMMFGIVWK